MNQGSLHVVQRLHQAKPTTICPLHHLVLLEDALHCHAGGQDKLTWAVFFVGQPCANELCPTAHRVTK